MQPRFQIFVSSTFRDLEKERQAALDAILELGHFPAGMEIFPAANSTPWELIERIIGESDYYVLIIGGRYGSTDETGIGYTEREYDLAASLKKPVLAFLHADPGNIPQRNSETDSEAIKRLAAFRNKVSHHHCKFWSSAHELKSQVVLGLTWAIRTNPTEGWVKAGGINNSELLARLADLQGRYDVALKENESLKDLIGRQVASDELAVRDRELSVPYYDPTDPEAELKSAFRWFEVFNSLAREMLAPISENRIKAILSNLIEARLLLRDEFKTKLDEVRKKDPTIHFGISVKDSFVKAILLEFFGRGLVESQSVQPNYPGELAGFGFVMNRSLEAHWYLTKKGAELFLDQGSNLPLESNEEPLAV